MSRGNGEVAPGRPGTDNREPVAVEDGTTAAMTCPVTAAPLTRGRPYNLQPAWRQRVQVPVAAGEIAPRFVSEGGVAH